MWYSFYSIVISLFSSTPNQYVVSFKYIIVFGFSLLLLLLDFAKQNVCFRCMVVNDEHMPLFLAECASNNVSHFIYLAVLDMARRGYLGFPLSKNRLGQIKIIK